VRVNAGDGGDFRERVPLAGYRVDEIHPAGCLGGDEPPSAARGGAQDEVIGSRGAHDDGAAVGEGEERGGFRGVAGEDEPRRLRLERVTRGTEDGGEGEAVEEAQAAVYVL
jgi:hypothetical protein